MLVLSGVSPAKLILAATIMMTGNSYATFVPTAPILTTFMLIIKLSLE
jgi:hypothetical protein